MEAWGFEDSKRTGHIKVNSQVIRDLTQTADSSTKGLHVVTLQESGQEYTVAASKQFDFSHLSQIGEFTDFIGSLQEKTVVLGASAEDIIGSFEPQVHLALASIHVNGSELKQQDSIAFVAKKGFSSFTRQQVKRKLRGPARIGRLIKKGQFEEDQGPPEGWSDLIIQTRVP